MQVVRWVDEVLHQEAAGAGHGDRVDHLKVGQVVVDVAVGVRPGKRLQRVQAGAAIADGFERNAAGVGEGAAQHGPVLRVSERVGHVVRSDGVHHGGRHDARPPTHARTHARSTS